MFGLAVIAIAAMSGAGAAGAQPQPVRLQVESQDGADVISVIAESATACSASYELTVGGGTGNTSVNRGSVTIPPARSLTLATVRLRRAGGTAPTAVLKVTPCNGAAYTIAWPADGPAIP